MTARELEKLLKRHGFEQVSQRGSHAKFRNADTGRQVIVPTHGSREIPVGTLKQILEGSGIPDSEWTN
jgi:predicted RNA binding protein YcfA (HicA-like mRNA interferase family)